MNRIPGINNMSYKDYMNNLKNEFEHNRHNWEKLPKGDSNQEILKNTDGSIKRYNDLKTELEDPRFKRLEQLYNENPNYLYFYDNSKKSESSEQAKYALLGTYTEDGSHIGISNGKYTLLFTSNAPTLELVTNVGNIFLDSGEIYCIKNIPDEINTEIENTSTMRGGKRRSIRKGRKSHRVKRRKSTRRVKRRNTKRRYRK